MEVLLYMLKGLSINEIASRLFLSSKTIHSYRSHFFGKLNVDSDVALTLLAIREGLITIDEAGTHG